MATQISKRKFVADAVFYAELNEVLTRELAEDGYSAVEVRVTPKGKTGPMTPLPDVVIIHAPTKDDVNAVPAQVVAPAALVPEAPLTTVDYPEMNPVA